LRLPAIGVVLLLLSSLIVGAAWPMVVEQFSVKPNAAQKERDYIDRSIAATRQAYGLETDKQVTYRDYGGEGTTAAEVKADPATISNIRLLDPTIVGPAFTQFQQGKNFYYFPDQLSTATPGPMETCATSWWPHANSIPIGSSRTSGTGSTGTACTRMATDSLPHPPTP
jgi:uncharacterized membrane protein (UPF0182 family)